MPHFAACSTVKDVHTMRLAGGIGSTASAGADCVATAKYCSINNRSFRSSKQSTPPSLLLRRARLSLKVSAAVSAFTDMTTLISFDVDGTLIRSIGEDANKLHKLAFAKAMKKVFDVDTNIDVIKHHGSTDPLILVSVLQHHGVPHEQAMGKLKEMEAVMNEYFEAHSDAAGGGLVVLPGVVELLRALQDRGDVVTCLVTGNLQPIGWGKMAALGLKDLFSQPPFGGFGSDHCSGNTRESWRDRAELVRIAAKRAQEASPGGIAGRYHVGDTPMDLQAADEAGARGVGVTTGIFSRAELAEASPGSVILPNLEDLDLVLRTFGLQQ